MVAHDDHVGGIALRRLENSAQIAILQLESLGNIFPVSCRALLVKAGEGRVYEAGQLVGQVVGDRDYRAQRSSSLGSSATDAWRMICS